MTGNIFYFASLTKIDDVNLTFGIKGKGKIYSEDTIDNPPFV